MEYRATVMRLLRASPVPYLDEPLQAGPLRRRVEGSVRLPHTAEDGTDLIGLVMFTVAPDGTCAMADLRSKHGGHTSAWSLLKIHPEASFIIVVTTTEPGRKARELAESYGQVTFNDGTVRPVIWILTVEQIIELAGQYEQVLHPRDTRPWWQRLLPHQAVTVAPKPVSPLLVAAQHS